MYQSHTTQLSLQMIISALQNSKGKPEAEKFTAFYFSRITYSQGAYTVDPMTRLIPEQPLQTTYTSNDQT